MSEELIVKAYELLEQKRTFSSLNSDEKAWVSEVFGTEQDYERILSLSAIALEEEEIIAPSMSVESILSKQYLEKHNAPLKNSEQGFSLITFLSKPIFKIALPSLILLLGITWFLNREMQFDQNVAVVETNKQTENKKTSENDDSEILKSETRNNGTDFRENGILSGTPNENVTFEAAPNATLNEINVDITDEAQFFEPSEDLVLIEDEIIEKLEEESEIDAPSDLEIKEEEQIKNLEVTQDQKDAYSAKGDNAAYTFQHDLNSRTSPSSNHNTFTWQDSAVTSIGTFTTQNAPESTIDKEVTPTASEDKNITIDSRSGNFYSADDAIGNSTLEPVSLDSEENSAYGEKYANKKVSTSSNAHNDISLFEFLYTTY